MGNPLDQSVACPCADAKRENTRVLATSLNKSDHFFRIGHLACLGISGASHLLEEQDAVRLPSVTRMTCFGTLGLSGSLKVFASGLMIDVAHLQARHA